MTVDGCEGGRAAGEEEEGRQRRLFAGFCLKTPPRKFVLYGIMAVNILQEVSGNAQRATVILLRKSHFVAISPAGLSKVRIVLWSFFLITF